MNTNEQKRKARVTIKDVAKASGVSIATVSYVLNNTPGQSISEDTRKKVLQFANLLGYECNIMAKYLASGKTNTVAAVITDFDLFASQYYLNLITELSRLLYRKDYELKIVDYSDALARNSTHCDAYITLGLDEDGFRRFADTKYVPVIAVDCVFEDFLFYRINDNYKNLCDNARRDSDKAKIEFLTFGTSRSSIACAESFFDGVTVVRNMRDIEALDPAKQYVTVSKAIKDCAAVPVMLENASFALKASAAFDAVIKALNRTQASPEEHDIKV